MSIGVFIKQKEFIRRELEAGNKDYEDIYLKAKKRQVKEEEDWNNARDKYSGDREEE